MNSIIVKTFFVVALFMLSSPVVAGETTPVQISFMNVDPAAAQEELLKNQALALKRLEFEIFAKSKVQQLNRNHILSRSRMEITKQLDGTYLARYHQVDDSSMRVKVSQSQSSVVPYVGVISYQEQILESISKSPEQFDQSPFAVVEVIPNRHIFSYQKGTWK
jgi:hypothetical protein